MADIFDPVATQLGNIKIELEKFTRASEGVALQLGRLVRLLEEEKKTRK